MPQHDVLIIGAGLAGQQAAAEAGATVAIMSKVHPVRSHSNAAAGGINAALNPRTPGNRTPSTPSRARTTWATRTRSRSCEAPNEILWLEALGVTFHRSKDGHLGTRAFGVLPGAHVLRGRHHRPGAAARPLRAAHEVPRAHRPLRVVRHLPAPGQRGQVYRGDRAQHPRRPDGGLLGQGDDPGQRGAGQAFGPRPTP